MFEGYNYKKQAKMQLAHHWKSPLLIGLFSAACLFGLYFVMFLLQFNQPVATDYMYNDGTFSALGIGMIISLVVYFGIGIIYMATSKFYLSFVKDNNNSTFSTFLEGFALWSKGIRGYLWMILWGGLWSLLFYIPGIIKLIAYSQMFFIMADSPKVGVRRAMKLSMEITRGHKGELFIMYLSFLGWYLLSLLTIGIGFLWLAPYSITSFTYAYQYMKQDAINRKTLTDGDFGEDESTQTIAIPTA